MRWNIIQSDGTELQEKYHLTSLAARVLAASDLSEEKIEELLNPGPLTTSHAPCVKQACARIAKAKENGEKVFIGGDYDADGICATAIMKKTLDGFGLQTGYYIPDRLKEGYGLSVHTVEMVHERGYSLIITVDNGVKAHDALKRAEELGMDVIVTDHHVIEEEIEADIVVHPDYMEETYRTLSGAGVALEISRNLIGDDPDLTSLAMAAAIGDVMPLWGETRRIVIYGLDHLHEGRPRSLCALLNNTNDFDEVSVAFQIVPKLNAVSRMDDDANPNRIVTYLLSDNPAQIRFMAEQINHENESRKYHSRTMIEKASALMDEKSFQVIYDPSFKQGLAGLAAGKIAEACHKPTLVLAEKDDLLTGSARSVDGFNIYDFFSDFNELEAFGGHAKAAGLSLKKENYASFCTHIDRKMQETGFVYEEPVQNAIAIDADEMTIDNVMGLSAIRPVPKDIQQPEFAIRNPVVLDKKEYTKVLRYHYANVCGGFDGVIFNQSVAGNDNPSAVIGTPSINRYRSRITVQMIIDAFKD